MNHTNALDGLRGVAVLIVFLSHTSGRDYAVATWLDFAGIGHVGVYLFFVLSAFLLTHKIILQNDWRIYLLRRFWRIAPLYYVVVLATFFIQRLTGQVYERYLHVADGWDGLVKHLLFFKGNGVFWTIPTEFSFYFALPIIIWWLNRYGWTLAVIAAGISSIWYLAIRAGAPLPAIAIVDTVHQTTYFEVFLVGIAAVASLVHRSEGCNSFLGFDFNYGRIGFSEYIRLGAASLFYSIFDTAIRDNFCIKCSLCGRWK